MNVFECLVTSLIIGIILAICAFFAHHPLIKLCESEISLVHRGLLYLVRTTHYAVALFIFLYVFFTEIVVFYDIFVMTFIVAIYAHWQVLDECILSVFERNIIKVERNMCEHPYLEIFGIHSKSIEVMNKGIWIPFAVLVLRILYRVCDKPESQPLYIVDESLAPNR